MLPICRNCSIRNKMAAPMKEFLTFSLPADINNLGNICKEDVCVVSIFGESVAENGKSTLINQILQRQVCTKGYQKVIILIPIYIHFLKLNIINIIL